MAATANDAIPANLDAERAVLGSLLMAGHLREQSVQFALVKTCERIAPPSDWWGTRNRNIFSAMLELNRQGKPLDNIPILEMLQEHGLQANDVSAYASYLANIGQIICTCEHAEAYAEIIHGYAQRRRGVQAAHRMAQNAWEGKLRGRVNDSWVQK
jgi:replicative DNA helicase